ncbi:TerC family protein [Inconstantimicrobium mannanitabidum]|uniref:Membrane protein n=1 Tax=Inconstantimicrobium mannanitabidum TaxID=1604901 RepID=A0ACB5RBB2_9CLOT|nr:TerC family protein [Clostridium sp. TW13]GKX66488.1 membrane protein [Clostridium sp. TW13]
MMSGILDNFSKFFDLHVLIATLSNPSNWMIILSLIILEGLLSSDNALVLAIMVKHLPKNQQRKALTYGIWGAYIFRFIAIGIGTYLMKIWWVKLIAAGYLIYMVWDYFRGTNKEDDDVNVAIKKGFWATVASVELMDISFSIDSVAAAFGVSSQVWVLFLGAVFGILAMRGVAKIFVTLIEKIPELETASYILIAIIGIKMLLGLINIEISNVIFFLILIAVFGVTIFIHKTKKNSSEHEYE